jgi:hypothetical protein
MHLARGGSPVRRAATARGGRDAMSTEPPGGPYAICPHRSVIVDDNGRFLSVAQEHLE